MTGNPQAMTEPEAHLHFAKQCFNETWSYVDKEKRTAEDNEAMIRLSQTSFWHWSRVETATPENISVGYWQLSRVHALAGRTEDALAYAEHCLKISEDASLAPFYRGYAHEALARAYAVRDNRKAARHHLDRALELAEQVDDADAKGALVADLEMIDPS